MAAQKFIMESDDEAEPSQEENFFMFLHHAKSHHQFSEMYKIFNTEFPFQKVIEINRMYIEDKERDYADRVCADAVLLNIMNDTFMYLNFQLIQ